MHILLPGYSSKQNAVLCSLPYAPLITLETPIYAHVAPAQFKLAKQLEVVVPDSVALRLSSLFLKGPFSFHPPLL